MLPFYVYILRCGDGSYYTGHTDDLEKRFAEHSASTYECYTKTRLPITLLFVQEFESRGEALEAERKIKKWGQRKKEALIYNGWEGIIALRKRKPK